MFTFTFGLILEYHLQALVQYPIFLRMTIIANVYRRIASLHIQSDGTHSTFDYTHNHAITLTIKLHKYHGDDHHYRENHH